MKARLEFDLPDEQLEFEICRKAGELHSNLWDLTEQIRTWRKHRSVFLFFSAVSFFLADQDFIFLSA